MSDEPKRRKKRVAQSEEALRALALRYLDRFAVPVKGMERYLKKKTREAMREGAIGPDEATIWVENVLARLIRVGLLDDEKWAEGRARALSRRGKSLRAIQYDLRRKGLSPEHIERAIEELSEDEADPELAAACRLARRRRLGPYYTGADRRERRQKHLGALARQGFSFDVAKKVVDAPDLEALDALLE